MSHWDIRWDWWSWQIGFRWHPPLYNHRYGWVRAGGMLVFHLLCLEIAYVIHAEYYECHGAEPDFRH